MDRNETIVQNPNDCSRLSKHIVDRVHELSGLDIQNLAQTCHSYSWHWGQSR